MEKISVIVPVYKTERYLKRCIDSIREQTYRNLEIILVDDGSPDRCPEICDNYSAKDERIKVIHKDNAGVAAARNTGLDAATGGYLTFVDSDDYIEPEMYESMMAVAVKYDSDIVMCDCTKVFPDHSELYTHNIRQGYYDKQALESEYYPHLLMMENVEYPPTISNWLCLFKKGLINGNAKSGKLCYVVGIRFSEDLLFGAQLMRRAESFYYMKEQAFYYYFMNPSSATHTYAPDKWENYRRLHKKIKQFFWNDTEYDFKKQVDLCLLFFLYNTIGDIRGTDAIPRQTKTIKIREILNDKEVRGMFKRIHIFRLPVSWKLKIISLCYKYRIGINILTGCFR